jgi:hypothetical protein
MVPMTYRDLAETRDALQVVMRVAYKYQRS